MQSLFDNYRYVLVLLSVKLHVYIYHKETILLPNKKECEI